MLVCWVCCILHWAHLALAHLWHSTTHTPPAMRHHTHTHVYTHRPRPGSPTGDTATGAGAAISKHSSEEDTNRQPPTSHEPRAMAECVRIGPTPRKAACLPPWQACVSPCGVWPGRPRPFFGPPGQAPASTSPRHECAAFLSQHAPHQTSDQEHHLLRVVILHGVEHPGHADRHAAHEQPEREDRPTCTRPASGMVLDTARGARRGARDARAVVGRE